MRLLFGHVLLPNRVLFLGGGCLEAGEKGAKTRRGAGRKERRKEEKEGKRSRGI